MAKRCARHEMRDQTRERVECRLIQGHDGRRPGLSGVASSPVQHSWVLAERVKRRDGAWKRETAWSSCRAAGADAAVPGKRHGVSEDGSIAVKAPPAVKARGVSTRGAPGDARERAAVIKGTPRAREG